jgi:hypothetical protein
MVSCKYREKKGGLFMSILLLIGSYIVVIAGIGVSFYGFIWIYAKLFDFFVSEIFDIKKEFVAYVWWKYHSKNHYERRNEEPTAEEINKAKKSLYN